MKNHFYKEAAQRLFRAVLLQAITDAADPNVSAEHKADALDFLFTERSNLHIFANGCIDVDAFRKGLRERMAAPVFTVNVEGKAPVTFRQEQMGKAA
jgi:hypothetical protein